MIIELGGLLTAVQGLSTLVEKTAAAVAAVRGRRSDAAKQQAEKHLAELSKALADVGSLARLADSYLAMHEDLARLQSSAERAERAINDNLAALDNVGNPARPARWDLVTQLVAGLQNDATVVRAALGEGSDRYFDRGDYGVIQTRFAAIDRSLVKVYELVAARSTAALQREVADVTSDIRGSAEGVHHTLETILDALRRVGQPGNV